MKISFLPCSLVAMAVLCARGALAVARTHHRRCRASRSQQVGNRHCGKWRAKRSAQMHNVPLSRNGPRVTRTGRKVSGPLAPPDGSAPNLSDSGTVMGNHEGHTA